jgi:hypothetical protein
MLLDGTTFDKLDPMGNNFSMALDRKLGGRNRFSEVKWESKAFGTGSNTYYMHIGTLGSDRPRSSKFFALAVAEGEDLED